MNRFKLAFLCLQSCCSIPCKMHSLRFQNSVKCFTFENDAYQIVLYLKKYFGKICVKVTESDALRSSQKMLVMNGADNMDGNKDDISIWSVPNHHWDALCDWKLLHCICLLFFPLSLPLDPSLSLSELLEHYDLNKYRIFLFSEFFRCDPWMKCMLANIQQKNVLWTKIKDKAVWENGTHFIFITNDMLHKLLFLVFFFVCKHEQLVRVMCCGFLCCSGCCCYWKCF